MPGVFRPYTLTDVLAGMADQNGQQSVDTTTSGLGFFGEVDETFLLGSTGAARGPLSSFNTSGLDTATLTWSTNPAAGSKILIVLWSFGETITSVQDNGTTVSTFTADVAELANGGDIIAIYRADNISLPASGSYKVTITGVGGGTIVAGGIAYTNVAAGPPTGTATNSSAGSTSVSTGTATGAAGAVTIAGFFDNTSLTSESITLTNPQFTQQFVEVNGNASNAGAIADQVAATPALQACTWTIGDSEAWVAAIATYPALAGIEEVTATVQLPSGWDGGEWCQFSWGDELQLLAATPLAGFALQNGTPTILSWTAPNDGQMHRVLVAMIGKVTSAETGGILNVTGTDPGGNGFTSQLDGGGHGAGAEIVGSVRFMPVAPGTTFSIVQGSALTAGAATAWFELWGQ